MKPLIFVAAYPDQQGRSPKYIDDLGKSYDVLHPCFNFDTPDGKRIAQEHKMKVIQDPLPYRGLQRRDFRSVELSQILIYDLDYEIGLHFLAVATIYQKPILAVSETLRGVNSYFSQGVLATIHPQDLDAHIAQVLAGKSYSVLQPSTLAPPVVKAPTE